MRSESATESHQIVLIRLSRAVLFFGNIFYLRNSEGAFCLSLVFRLLLRLQTSTFICCSPLILQALNKLIRKKLWHPSNYESCSTTLNGINDQFHAGQMIISQPELNSEVIEDHQKKLQRIFGTEMRLSFCLTTMYIPHLVGGWTNPFEKYARQNGSFPQMGVSKNRGTVPPNHPF